MGPCESLLGADFIPRVKPHLLKLEPQAPNKDNPQNLRTGQHSRASAVYREGKDKQQEMCQRDTQQKIKMPGRMPAQEIGNALSHICSQDNHTLGVTCLALSRVKLQQDSRRDRKAQAIMIKNKN